MIDIAKATDRRGLPPLPLGRKLGYGAGALLDGIATQAINIFLLFYATAVSGIPPALAGAALAAGLVVDAIVDPLIGSLSDGWRSRHGRRVPFMLLGTPLTIMFLALLFALPPGWSVPALFLWLTLASIGLRVSISLFLLPYNAVGAELSDGYAERSSIAAWRWGFAMSLGVLVAIGSLIAVRTLRGMPERQFAPIAGDEAVHRRLPRELSELFRNPSFRTLFFGAILLFTSAAIHSTLNIHANTYFWRMVPGQIQVVTLALFLGLLCGAPLAGPMLRVMEKRSVLMLGILGLGVAYALAPTLRLAGLIAPDAPPVGLLAGSVFIGGALLAAAAIAAASMMADATDEHEHLFGARREGIFFAGWAFAGKAAAGFGSLIAGLALQAIAFPSGTAAQGAAARAALSPDLIWWLGAIYGPGTGLLAAGAAAFCLTYRLDAARHRTILSELAQRRAALAAGGAISATNLP